MKLSQFYFPTLCLSLALSCLNSASLKISGTRVATVLKQLGAEMEQGVTLGQIEGYSRHFDFADRDRDGRHSKEEYIENGRYLTPQSRRGIFNASDNDGDGFVTRVEYILNRIITDEAKGIVQAMDGDKDGSVQRAEFMKAAMKNKELAGQVFGALDTDDNGTLIIPEYLKVWGKWARSGRPPAEKRIHAREAELRKLGTTGTPARPRGVTGRPGGPPFGRPGLVAHLLQYDTNGDGRIEPKELLGLIRRADLNKDGVLDREELEAIGPPAQGREHPPRRP
jgi:Ca2+-binding EF-hand superfamily protein